MNINLLWMLPVLTAAAGGGEYQPAAVGPCEVATAGNVILHDEKRNKDLPLFVSYPKGSGKCPVIVFSHGAMGSGDMRFPIVDIGPITGTWLSARPTPTRSSCENPPVGRAAPATP